MARCLSLGAYSTYSPDSTSPPPSPETGRSSISNVARRKYVAAVGSRSYNEIWHSIHRYGDADAGDGGDDADPAVVEPDGECVEGVMRMVKPGPVSRMASSYFEHSETTAQLCHALRRSVARARLAYAPLQALLRELDPESSLNEAQCDRAFEVLAHFDEADEPFPSERDEFQRLKSNFSDLKADMRARVQARRRGLSRWHTVMTCQRWKGAAVVKAEEGEEVEVAVWKGTFVADDLQTVESLVGVVECAVVEDRHAVRMALLHRPERHLLQEVLKQLRKTNLTLLAQLQDLDVHTCHCLTIVNNTRSQLLQNVYTTQTLLLEERRLKHRRTN